MPRAAYDGIVSSGDVTRALIAARAGARVFHIGPERDVALFEGLDAPTAPLEHADYAVCTGLYDDTVETPHDYRDVIARMRARSLPMICANPDLVVHRGAQLCFCAGALAKDYEKLGGEAIYYGKPVVVNDPHREVTNPSLRYIVHLNAPGWNVIGAGEPPFAGVAIGHNDRLAWGLTIVGGEHPDQVREMFQPFPGSDQYILLKLTICKRNARTFPPPG